MTLLLSHIGLLVCALFFSICFVLGEGTTFTTDRGSALVATVRIAIIFGALKEFTLVVDVDDTCLVILHISGLLVGHGVNDTTLMVVAFTTRHNSL
jgi:hypothetical protein